MTLIVSWALPEAVVMLSDRAVLLNGRMIQTIHKVTTEPSLMVTGAGNLHAVNWFVDKFMRRQPSPSKLKDAVQACAREMLTHYGVMVSQYKASIAIGAYDPLFGGRLFTFDTSSYSVSQAQSWTNCGDVLPNDLDLAMCGKHQAPGESAAKWAERCGADFMEIARKNTELREGKFVIGGGVDLTIIDANGARHVPLRSWKQDKIGRSLKPLRRR